MCNRTLILKLPISGRLWMSDGILIEVWFPHTVFNLTDVNGCLAHEMRRNLNFREQPPAVPGLAALPSFYQAWCWKSTGSVSSVPTDIRTLAIPDNYNAFVFWVYSSQIYKAFLLQVLAFFPSKWPAWINRESRWLWDWTSWLLFVYTDGRESELALVLMGL